MRDNLTGCRILVVEDEIMVALLVEDVLAGEHCTVIGPFGDLDHALTAAVDENPDLAVLDINVGGRMVFPLADMLTSRGGPLLLLTGYGSNALPRDCHWPICSEPFKINELVARLQAIAPAGQLPT
jgi:CheY-like chemotaxis protein